MTQFIRPDTDEMLEAYYGRPTNSGSLKSWTIFAAKLIGWTVAGIATVALILALSVGLMSRVRTELAVTPEHAIAMMEAE